MPAYTPPKGWVCNMPNLIMFGIFKNNQISNGSSLSLGQSVIQNRNQTKQNNAAIGIGDGLFTQSILTHLNQDTDMIDSFSADGPDISLSPQT